MPVTSSVHDVGSMGDRKYAYGFWKFSGVGRHGSIDVPLGRVDNIQFTANTAHIRCPGLRVSGVEFPYSTTQWHTLVPVVLCSGGTALISGAAGNPISGLWWAFGKRG